jgi:OFA family oxalate/formate antiporter-like MFS transporter
MTSKPWVQLITGIICMAMIANLQYGWTLFVDPIDAKYHWGRAAIQLAFTIFVIAETWLVPIKSWIVDRYSPRLVAMSGGVLVGLAWIINANADSLTLLYTGAVVGGAGAAAVYGTCIGNALKWFPKNRGLAAGFTAAGFGIGAALTVVPIAQMIRERGYEAAFLYFGIGQAVIIFIAASIMRKPAALATAGTAAGATSRDSMPLDTLRTPVFWVMYVMFVLVAAGGLTAAAQIAPIAHDYKIADVPVNLFGLAFPALTFAISLNRIFDGIGRPTFGFISDRIGRENTMAISFVIQAVSLALLSMAGSNPVVFVLVTTLFFFVFGNIYSLFPAACGDTFGSKFATTNAGLLYTAKGTASFLVPIASAMAVTGQGWGGVFMISMTFSLIAAGLALFVLRPMRARFIAGVHRRTETRVPA